MTGNECGGHEANDESKIKSKHSNKNKIVLVCLVQATENRWREVWE